MTRHRRILACVSIAVTSHACATHRVPPNATGQTLSRDWTSVRTLGSGAFVTITVDACCVSHGYVREVTDTAVTLRERDGGVRTIPRDRIERVEMTVRLKNADAMNGFPIGAGMVGGLAGTFVGVAVKNRQVQGWSLAVLGTSLIAGFAYLARHDPWEPDYATRVVYARP